MKRKKIAMLFIVILAILKSTSYAKYVYQFEETIIQLKRDSDPPICNVTYSTEEITKENVTITISVNKEVEQVSGFVLSEDKKKLTKEVSENEAGIIKIRDFLGNDTEVEYAVNNIDKEAPKIIGCENGQTYQAPISLDYFDNTDIKEVVVDRYTNQLEISLHEIYCDSYSYFGIDRTDTTLTIQVNNHPKDSKKYKYYINNELYTTTTDTKYTFTGLTKGTNYTIKIEAINEMGEILDSNEIQAKTSYYHEIESKKTTQEFFATLYQIDKSVEKIKYAVWNGYDSKNIQWYDAAIHDGEAKISCIENHKRLYPLYMIHAYLYDKYDNILDVVGFSIDFGTNYEKKDLSINKNELTEPGNYQIIVKDFADNEIIYYIKVE